MVDVMVEYSVELRVEPSADSLADVTVVPSDLLLAASMAEMLVVYLVEQ